MGLVAVAALAAACAPRERTLVLLSTNDMHAKIQNFPRLASAVEACRDTAQLVVLVDAGDRWTGNAYVDMAPTPGMPMIALMNELGFDVATLGNHEFDHGQAFLGRMIDSMDFEVVCANVVSDTCTFPQLPPYTVIDRDGIRIGFVGVVTNYEGPGHPAGNESSFAGLEFPDPQAMALKYAAELRPECDVLVLVSHMGDDRDAELLAKGQSQYDVVIGGHTHEEVDTLIGGTLLTQTGKDLRNIGVTTVRMKGHKVSGVDYRIVPLADYEPDILYQKQVEAYYADPELNKPVGRFGNAADKWGLANWMAAAVADEADADVGFYHIGGVRLDSIPAGGVSAAKVYGLEPFGTLVARMEMPPAQMRPRRAVPEAARGAEVQGRRERLYLPELQGYGIYRRGNHRREGGRHPARRAQGRQPAEDRQHPAAAGGAQIGAADDARRLPRDANNRLIFCRFAKNRYLCSPHVCA